MRRRRSRSTASTMYHTTQRRHGRMRAVKAVLLVAGMSSRLRPLTNELPKCLLEVAGAPILRRCVESLRAAGIAELVVVTGFQEAKIRAALPAWFPGPITYRRNETYEQTQNGASLLCARDLV